ncbi:elongation factor P hydroxylase [Kangiella shandongensis]|uniref:elongation factor P hydroxylase n=1 Tax=Kangiella shandongensis TaxID=2763258 RepID=UPI001CBC1D64|nr:elongation factor P hydroxylase [Kangiella shandongensis]
MLFEQPISKQINSEQEHCVYEFAKHFNQYFAECNIQLIPGADEPFYRAARSASEFAIIYSTYDYFSSALHELAHWCIAGEQRRQRDDYGYWYEPDGRSAELQQLFYQVEQKPQALEWAFSLAADLPFRLSLDNFNNTALQNGEVECFRDAVFSQLKHYFNAGFPYRAQRLIALLCRLYRNQQPIQLPQKSRCLL